jgi:3-methyladenine DNA glycosylase AlkD
VPSLADEIVARLNALPDQSAQPVRRLRREYSRQLASAPAADVFAVAERLLDPPRSHMRRFVAYELIAQHRAARAQLDAEMVERLACEMADWGAVDMFGCFIAGPTWRAGHLGDDVVHRWARSPDRWWRRAALVSTTILNARSAPADAARTLGVAELLVADRDDMVVKAMSWALRELAKRDPQAVVAFLSHQPDVAPRVRREVTHKLQTGRKN